MHHRCAASGRLLALVVLLTTIVSGVARADIAEWGRTLREVGPKGKGHAEAQRAAASMSALDPASLPDILAEMREGNVLADNWFRGVVESIADRALASDKPLPVQGLRSFVENRRHAPRARWLAYDLIMRAQPQAKAELLKGRLDDPSLLLRRDAVALAVERATKLEAQDARLRAYREALAAARDVDQIDDIAKRLRDGGEEVDLAKAFGFIRDWNLIGPFDNKEDKGFDKAYPPETTIDLKASLPGVSGPVSWKSHSTDDDHGVVDLNRALDRHKGAIAYAYCEFDASSEQSVELRFGSKNANKLWLNGELLTANHVYHAGMFVDQYKGFGRLRKGRNTILLKIAQNEQTQSWAQEWRFQLRVCDKLGTAVLSAKSATAATQP